MRADLDAIVAAACAARLVDRDVAAIGRIEVLGQQADRARACPGQASRRVDEDVAGSGRALFRDHAVAGMAGNAAGRVECDVAAAALNDIDAVDSAGDGAAQRDNHVGGVAGRRKVDRVAGAAGNIALAGDGEITRAGGEFGERAGKAEHVVQLQRIVAAREGEDLRAGSGEFERCAIVDGDRTGGPAQLAVDFQKPAGRDDAAVVDQVAVDDAGALQHATEADMNGVGNRGRAGSDIDGAAIVDCNRRRTLRRTQRQAGSLDHRARARDGEGAGAAGLAGDREEARIDRAAVLDRGAGHAGPRNPERLAVECGIVDVERIGDAGVEIERHRQTVGGHHGLVGHRQRGRAIEPDDDILVWSRRRVERRSRARDIDAAAASDGLPDVQEAGRERRAGLDRQRRGTRTANGQSIRLGVQAGARSRNRNGSFVVDSAAGNNRAAVTDRQRSGTLG